MKVWITKYALTQGILEKDVEVCSDISEDMVKTKNIWSECFHGKGREWHLTKEDAIKKAEEMKQKKIKNVEKELDKLRQMKFE